MKSALELRNLSLIILIVSYFIVVGADIFGQAAISWTVLDEPPRSLSMFQGDYVYDSSTFWKVATTAPLVLFFLALLANWKNSRRRFIAVSFAAYVVINIVSFAYVFPEYLDIVSSTYSNTVDPVLQKRGQSWEILAFVRWLVVVGFGVPLLVALSIAVPNRDEFEA